MYTYVDPQGVTALTANHLIALDKCPGVCPIGVGEIVRRIISKAVLFVIKSDVLEAAGTLQLCAKHEAGCEAAIHSMCRIFHDATTEAVLLVDANNAFNSLNRKVALMNIHQLCTYMYSFLELLTLALTGTSVNSNSAQFSSSNFFVLFTQCLKEAVVLLCSPLIID